MKRTLEELFQSPDRKFAPVVFWAINHHLEPEEIRWQVREMAAQGVGGFFFHPREGLHTPYFSARYWEALSAAVEEAERSGVHCWLYDEDPYPSGMAGGKVALERPEFVARQLVHGEALVEGGQQVYVRLGGDRLLAVIAMSEEGQQSLDVTEYAGRARHDWHRYFRRAGYYPGMPTPPDYHWRAGASDGAYTLDWEAPAGQWRILWLGERNMFGDFPHEGYTDMTNSEAVRYFIELTHDECFRRYGDKFGSVIPGIFTDEPKPYGGWGKNFLERFQEEKRYDLRPLLPHLFYDIDRRTPQVRADYQRVLLRFWLEAFWEPIYDWCDEKGIAFTGHASPEEDPLGEVNYMVNLVPCLERMQIPGTDLITTKRIGDRQNAIMNLSPRLVSSVAHQTGKERVLCECFGLTEWDVTLADMKFMADWLLVQGVNLINPHMFMYSIDGFRKFEAPPSEFYQASYWRHYHLLADYITRLCQMFTGGEHVSHIALLRPHRSLLTLLPTRREEAEGLRDSFVEIHQWLTENNYEFDQLDESLLQKAEVADGTIRLSSEEYKVLIIPPITAIEQASLPILESYIANGGRVIWIGGDDVFVIDGEADKPAPILPEGVVRLKAWSAEPNMERLASELDVTTPRAIWADSPQVYIQPRRKDGRDLFFLFNTEATAVTTTVRLSATDSLERWDAASGAKQPVELKNSPAGKYFELSLESHGSVLLVSGSEGASAPEATSLDEGHGEITTLASIDRWQATLLQDNVLILDKWNVRVDDDGIGMDRRWFDDFSVAEYGKLITLEPAEKNWQTRFVGDQPADFDVWYANGFYVTDGVRDCRLVWETESIQGEHDIWVNGTKIEDFHRERIYDAFNLVADIQPLVRSNATNSMTVRVHVRKRNDGLLEPMRVFGKFRVNLDAMQLDAPITSLHSGSWTDQGLPHYAHDVAYESSFHLDSIDGRILLDLGAVRDIAEVFINGQHVATRAWRPFRIDLTENIRVGENHLRIVVTGNSANLFYGARRASGLMQSAKVIALQQPATD